MLQLARRLTARRLKAFSIRTLSAASSQDSPKRVPLAAGGIGVAGLIPFVGSTVGIVMYPSATAELLHLQSAYGATILSFMGAVHWGLAMASYNPLTASTNAKRFVLSTVPCLSAFVSLLVPHVPIQIAIQLTGFIGLYGADFYSHVKSLVPPWYLSLRSLLTGVVTLCMGGTLYTVYQRENELPGANDDSREVV